MMLTIVFKPDNQVIQMKKRFVIMAIFLLASFSAFAQTLEQAIEHYNAGDYHKAEKILQKLSTNKNHYADFMLGNIYLDGLTSAPDTQKAVKHFLKAIDGKHRQAAFTLGRMYLSGMGVPLDTDKGAYYTTLANSFPTEGEEEDECE
jgi:TPR repeat protein